MVTLMGGTLTLGYRTAGLLVQLLREFGTHPGKLVLLCTLLGPEGPGPVLRYGIGPLDHDLLGRGFRTRVWCSLWGAVERVPPVF
jgi:hypothetical protein